MYDTLIIGAGMSGLAAGIRLALYDQKVAILERHYTIGGLNSFYRLRGRDYDVGLHAVTNFTPKGFRKGPLAKILRQLRFSWDDFGLSPQVGSEIAFPDVRLRFDNDIDLLTAEVGRAFPGQRDNWAKLLDRIAGYDDLTDDLYQISARQVLGEVLTDPLLIEMLLCPLMWYGSARERDMDFGQFSIMFRAIFLEGFARPHEGVRVILRTLVKRFRELGGELKLRSGVSRIKIENGRAVGVVLDNGTELAARHILSSAGWFETMRMCSEPIAATSTESAPPAAGENAPPSKEGQLSFVESLSILDCPPVNLGYDRTIVFFNDSPRFDWSRPRSQLCDVRTGVICSPNNYLYGDSAEGKDCLPDGVMRVTALADYDLWQGLDEERYPLEKLRWYDRLVASSCRFVPDYRGHVIDTDTFTPRTIHRFTWKVNGAVYGAPEKHLDGATPYPGLSICGTDQGFVGIIGSILSGIAMANRWCLSDAT